VAEQTRGAKSGVEQKNKKNSKKVVKMILYNGLASKR